MPDREEVLFVTVAVVFAITTVFPSVLFVRLVSGASLETALWLALPVSAIFVVAVVVVMRRTHGRLVPPLE